MLEETLEVLAKGTLGAGASARVLDCTFGGGGHTRALLECYPDCSLTAIDTDPDALKRAEALEKEFAPRFSIVDSNFGDLADLGLEEGYDGILFDLGVSSYHFDTPLRGFSFRFDGPLDMRMNPREGLSAAEFLERADSEELVRAVRDYAQEPRWRRVVNAITEARGSGALARTGSFVKLLQSVLGSPRPGRIHPATLVFQGIRIAVNGELASIERALPAAFDLLKSGGVLAVISFHSLEDRIVKRFFREKAGRPIDRFDNTPQQERVVLAKLLKNKPITSSKDELEDNPRARSAKLRALRKL